MNPSNAPEFPATGYPVNQIPVNRLTTLVNQSSEPLSPSPEPIQQTTPLLNEEAFYPSRTKRRLKGIRLPVQKLIKWEMFCLLHGMSFQEAVERAMDLLAAQPVNWLTTCRYDDHDDDWKDEVIIFFERLTGTRWKRERDDEARKEVSQYTSVTLKCGIAVSVYRFVPKRPEDHIGSFRYCLGAIHEAAQAGAADPEQYLEYVLGTLARDGKMK